ncbi:MAG: hypothetical protein LQ337_004567 [Flavoplaca oasis]|nr:MAG: hypothetical protein LQ337_004567 [Flavoplaca oasis]
MQRFSFLVLLVAVSFVRSELDLACLKWSWFSPAYSLICHFAPKKLGEAESATVSAAKEAIQSVKTLGEFDLTHNPIAITYNAIEAGRNGGPGASLQSLESDIGDFAKVSIGFLKGSANQLAPAVQLYDATHWNDVAFCLIKGAGRLALQAKRKSRKRAGLPAGGDARTMAEACFSAKFNQIAKPPRFNVTDKDEGIGVTISQIAPFLVPVEAAEAVATDTGAKLYDLAIPGSEDTARILKNSGNGAEHFASEEEARAAAKSMEEETFVKEKCGMCAPPAPSTNTINFRRLRRGNIVSTCCGAPATLPASKALKDFETRIDVTDGANTAGVDDAYASDDQTSESDPSNKALYDPTDYNAITEADLVPAPDYVLRDPRVASDIPLIMDDLNKLTTARVAWSSKLIGSMSSEDLFASFRQVFTAPENNELARALYVKNRDGKLRIQSFSNDWISKPDPILKPYQDFVNTAVTEALDTISRLKNWTPEQLADHHGSIEFFYTPPSDEALAGVDPRGFHVDSGLMQFAAADTPGLIIRAEGLGSASRVPVVPNTFQLIKATFWDIEGWVAGTENGPTYHSVFGPEMARDGRVSMVLSVAQKGRPI